MMSRTSQRIAEDAYSKNGNIPKLKIARSLVRPSIPIF